MPLLVLAALAALAWAHRDEFDRLQAWIEAHPYAGAFGYVAICAASVVLLPFSSLPLLPLATNLWGVWIAGALSAAGWWLGALLAFLVAREGRRVLERFVSLASIDRLERSIPGDLGFCGIVLLRMAFPVDVVSFALGLLRGLRFRTYASASLVGIVPFAFAWSWAGGELGAGRIVTFTLVAAALVLAGLLVRRRWLARQ